MRQDVTADAAAMGRELTATGKTIIYGIYFDTGPAVIKPQSEPALIEMVKLLKTTPALRASRRIKTSGGPDLGTDRIHGLPVLSATRPVMNSRSMGASSQ